MEKLNHFLPTPQVKELRAMAKKRGVSVAELIRRAIAEYLFRERQQIKTARGC